MRVSSGLAVIVFIVLLVIGGAAGYGIGRAQTNGSTTQTLCQDALARRRQAEQALVAVPPAAGDQNAQSLADVKLNEARQLANMLSDAANTDIGKYCK